VLNNYQIILLTYHVQKLIYLKNSAGNSFQNVFLHYQQSKAIPVQARTGS